MKKEIYIVVSDGAIVDAYDNEEDAEARVGAIEEDNLDYVTEEYGLDPDDDNYGAEAGYMAGYDGDYAYIEHVVVDERNPEKMYHTSEGDDFSGSEILDAYKATLESEDDDLGLSSNDADDDYPEEDPLDIDLGFDDED